VVARVIIKVGNEGVEANPSEEFAGVLFGFRDDAAELFDKDKV